MTLIPTAYAAETAAAIPPGAGYTEMILLAVFALVAYFLLIRPQSKRMKEQKQLVSSVEKGDEIVTAGGIMGKVVRLDEQFMVIAVSEGVEIKFQRQAVTQILPKGTIKSI